LIADVRVIGRNIGLRGGCDLRQLGGKCCALPTDLLLTQHADGKRHHRSSDAKIQHHLDQRGAALAAQRPVPFAPGFPRLIPDP
jgi:hypothetical protein